MYAPVYFPRKPYLIPHQHGKSVFRPKRPKNPTLWAAHTYMAYIKEYPPGPDPFHDCKAQFRRRASVVPNLIVIRLDCSTAGKQL